MQEKLSQSFLSIICQNPGKQRMTAPTPVGSNISVYSEVNHAESGICARRFREK